MWGLQENGTGLSHVSPGGERFVMTEVTDLHSYLWATWIIPPRGGVNFSIDYLRLSPVSCSGIVGYFRID